MHTGVRDLGDSMTYLLYTAKISQRQPAITLSWEHVEYFWKIHKELHGFEKAFQDKFEYLLKHDLLK
jgi:hypothetical protein